MHPTVSLAKSTVEAYLKERKIISPSLNFPKEFLKKRAGTFVTIKKNKKLRGCIGTYLPTKENIAQEIIHNAIAAATEDYRFGLVQQQELPFLSYTIYVLSKPKLIRNISKLNPKKFGIIIKTVPIISTDKTDVFFNGHLPLKSGLLLPDLEGIDTAAQQIAIACQKGGIDPRKERIIIYKFAVKKYS